MADPLAALLRIGHRGAPRDFPENSLPAFERALELGANGIELDVHASSDGVVLVHHDPLVGAPGATSRRAIESTPWADISAVTLAPGIPIPTLAQVLAFARGRATVYVEIKGRGIEPAVLEVLANSGADCAIHSFDHALVARAHALDGGMRCGILFDRYPTSVTTTMRESGALDVWPHWRLIDRSLVDAVHDVGGRVIAWTVNGARAAVRLVRMGVDGICTDDLRVLERPS